MRFTLVLIASGMIRLFLCAIFIRQCAHSNVNSENLLRRYRYLTMKIHQILSSNWPFLGMATVWVLWWALWL